MWFHPERPVTFRVDKKDNGAGIDAGIPEALASVGRGESIVFSQTLRCQVPSASPRPAYSLDFLFFSH